MQEINYFQLIPLGVKRLSIASITILMVFTQLQIPLSPDFLKISTEVFQIFPLPLSPSEFTKERDHQLFDLGHGCSYQTSPSFHAVLTHLLLLCDEPASSRSNSSILLNGIYYSPSSIIKWGESPVCLKNM